METNNKIQHFIESNTRPINCETLFERGYVCKKFNEGKCSCKAPASLIYEPLTVDELSIELLKQPVLKNITKDVEQAAAFISEYLYNIPISRRIS